MKIKINNSEKEIASSNIKDLIAELGIKANGIAIAQNNQIIPFKLWESTLISSTDNLTIIKATQGG